MSRTFSTTSALAATSILLLTACPSTGGGDTDGATSGSMTTTTDSTTANPTTMDATTMDATTVNPTTASTTSDTTTGGSSSTTTTAGSSSTGAAGDCVDEDIGNAVGAEVVSAATDDQGDDFTFRFCDDGGATTGIGTTGFGTTGTTGGFGSTGTTGGFGTSGTTGFSESGDDFVVSWTPPSTGPFVIDTFGSDIDTVLSVVAPECGAAQGDCNDDCEGYSSGLVFEATDGETVYIVIEGYSGRQGGFVLNITEGDTLSCGGFGTTGPGTSAG